MDRGEGLAGNSYNYQWTTLEIKGQEVMVPGNTVLLFAAEARPLAYAFSNLTMLYVFGAASLSDSGRNSDGRPQ